MKRMLLLLLLVVVVTSVSAKVYTYTYEVCTPVPDKKEKVCGPNPYDDCWFIYTPQPDDCKDKEGTFNVADSVSTEDILAAIEDATGDKDAVLTEVTAATDFLALSNLTDAIETIGDLDDLKNNLETEVAEIRTELEERNNVSNTTETGDPVRIALGTFVTSEIDFSYSSYQIDIRLSRFFDSENRSSHSLGIGWTFNYDTRVIRGSNPGAFDLQQQAQETYDNITILLTESKEKYNSALQELNDLYDSITAVLDTIDTTITSLEDSYNSAPAEVKPKISADLQIARTKQNELVVELGEVSSAIGALEDSYSNITELESKQENALTSLNRLKDEAGLSSSNEELNKFTFNFSDPDLIQYSGINTLNLIDAIGTPSTYNIDTSPDYNSTVNHSDGSINFWPNGSTTTALMVTDDVLELIPNGSWVLTKKNKTKYYFSLYGQLTAIEDPNGNSLEFTYDSSHGLVQITDDFGREIDITRSGDKIVSMEVPDGSTVSYTYDSNGILASVTDIEGDTVRYTYYSTDELEKIIKPDNSFRQYNYITQDGKRVVESTVDEEGDTEYFNYNFDEGYTEYTNPAGVSEFHYYDDRNRETKVVYADGSYVENTYDDDNNLTSTRSRTGYVTDFKYDESSNITRIDYPDGTYENRSYNAFSKLTELRDPDGNRVVNDYDTKGNLTLTKIYGNSGAVESEQAYSYTTEGLVKSKTSWNTGTSLNTTEYYYYDDYGNISSVTDGEGNTWDYDFGVTGLLESVTDPLGNATEYEYTSAGKITKVIYPDNTSEQTFYTNRKDIDYVIDRDGNRYEYTYDKRHNLLSVENPLGETVEYTYNPMGEVLTKSVYSDTDNLESYREYLYDGYTGELITRREQLADTAFAETHYQYDNGLIFRITDPVGTTTELSYGPRDKATARTVFGETLEFPVTEYLDYTGRGLLEKYTDGRGNETRYEYTALGRAALIINPDSSEQGYTYDGQGRLISAKDEEGYTTQYKYNNKGRRTKVIYSDNTNESWKHNEAGYVIGYTDRNGIDFKYDVDAFGRIITKELPEPYTGAAERFTWNNRDQVLTYTDPNNNVWIRNYDLMGKLIEIIDPEGNITQNEYTALGQIEKTITPDEALWEQSYDMAGRVVTQTDPLGAVSRYGYNANGRLLFSEDPMGRKNNYTWDSLGRLAGTRDNTDTGVDYTYDEAGNRTSETQTGGTPYEYFYDSRNRLSREVNRLNDEKLYDYFRNGQIKSITDFNGNKTTFTYNEAARLTEKEFENGDKERYTYDNMGNLLTAVNPSSDLEYTYDPLGRITKSVDHFLDQTINYLYDPSGNRTEMSWLEDMRTFSYTYGSVNELVSVTDPEGEITSFEYDPLGRETKKILPNEIVSETSYDPAGRITSIVNKTTHGQGHNKKLKSLAYLYNAAGERTYQIEEDGQITAYLYDPSGRIESVMYSFDSGKKLEDFNGMLNMGLYPEQLDKGKTGFDIPEIPGTGSGHLEGDLKHLLKDHEDLYLAINDLDKKTKLSWDVTPKDGALDFARQMNLFFETKMALKDAYGVISHNQNHDLDTNQWMWSESFSYDSQNNLSAKANGWGVIDYTYNAENEILQSGNRTFEHDANGNLTKEVLGSVTADYSYNPANRVEEVNSTYSGFLGLDPKTKTSMVQYEYDAFGRRSSRTGYSEHEKHGTVEMKVETQTNHLYDGLGFNVLAEFTNNNDKHGYGPMYEPMSEYLFANGDILSRSIFKDTKYRGNEWDVKVKDTGYYHQDSLGSTVMVTNEKGHVEGSFSYDAFGTLYDDSRLPWGHKDWEQGGKHSAPLHLYNGKRLDPVVGLYDYGFRDYDPQVGRFTTVDPIKSGLNWYVYVGNDPVNFIDPLGLEMSLLVDKDTQTMVVIVTNDGTTETRTIDVTTGVVSHNPEPNTDTSRTQTSGSNITNPTQFPNGTYNVTTSDANPTGNDRYGDTWLVTDATQELSDINTGETVTDTGYNVHLTSATITNGCIGVQSEDDMDWLNEQFTNNELIDPDSTTITVIGGDPTTIGTSSTPNKENK